MSLREEREPKGKVEPATGDKGLKNTSGGAPQLPPPCFVFMARASTSQSELPFPKEEIDFLPKGSTDPK